MLGRRRGPRRVRQLFLDGARETACGLPLEQFFERAGNVTDAVRGRLLLLGEDVNLTDIGWRGKQLIGFPHQSRGDASLKMSRPSGLIGKRVENAEGLWTRLKRVPRDRLLFLAGKFLG